MDVNLSKVDLAAKYLQDKYGEMRSSQYVGLRWADARSWVIEVLKIVLPEKPEDL